MTHPMNMSRRDALGASAGLVAGAALEVTLASCRAEPPAARASDPAAASAAEPATPVEPGRFSREQQAIVEAAADFLIPETSSPGAQRAEVPGFIEGVVFEVLDADERRAFCAALDAIDAAARQRHGASFSSCAAAERGELVRRLFTPASASELAFRKRLRELIITGFCKSRFGATRVLQYDPIPGAYDGCRSLESVGRAWATS